MPPTGIILDQADATANLTLTTSETTSYQDVPGATLTLATPGTYMITGEFHFRELGTGDEGGAFIGRLVVGGAAVTGWPLATILDGQSVLLSNTWVITTTADDTVVKLQAKKSDGTGSSRVTGPGHTRIIALGP